MAEATMRSVSMDKASIASRWRYSDRPTFFPEAIVQAFSLSRRPVEIAAGNQPSPNRPLLPPDFQPDRSTYNPVLENTFSLNSVA